MREVKGYYILPSTGDDGTPSDYDSYTYYFATQQGSAVRIYVLEGVCRDKDSSAELAKVMKGCIKSITIKKPVDEPA